MCGGGTINNNSLIIFFPTCLFLNSSHHQLLREEILDDMSLKIERNCSNGGDDDIPQLNLDAIRLRPIIPRRLPGWSPSLLDKTEIYDCNVHRREIEQYRCENLNSDQLKIYKYVLENPKNIITIQAGPGCGKSFVLKSIAYNHTCDIETIIYKNDLLSAFKYNSRRFTVAKFIMQTLKLSYYQYMSMDLLLTSRMDSYEFTLIIISMLKKADLPDIYNSIVFLDEYTVMEKQFLLMILILLEHCKIGAVICGDRNQLQPIHNSKHAILSSYAMAEAFSTKTFTLSKNERCENSSYNKIIEYFSEFSSNQQLDTYAYAMVSAFFLRQLIEPPKYTDIHLAAKHQELSDLAHMLVCNNAYHTEFYFIDQSNVRDRAAGKSVLIAPAPVLAYNTRIMENKTPKVDKFLPYLPLVVGGRYYYQKHSDQAIVTLVNIDVEKNEMMIQTDQGDLIAVTRSSNYDSVIFEQHRDFLLDKVPGKIYNYPLYPANFMSMHKCQGCTITEDLDLLLNSTNYQGLYVALSRVTDPKQIHRITIPNQISHIISTIINFPQYCRYKSKSTNLNDGEKNNTINDDDEKIIDSPSVDDVRDGMINYIHYEISNNQSDLSRFSLLASEFLLSNDVDTRISIRDSILDLVNTKSYRKQILVQRCQIESIENPHSLLTMNVIIKHRHIILALSRIEEFDRNVWLHEFMLDDLDMLKLFPEMGIPNTENMSTFMKRDTNVMTSFAGLNNAYGIRNSTISYIESIAKTNIIVDPEEQQRNAKYCIKIVDSNVFVLTTEFCAKVYKYYEIEKKSCSSAWLINELNIMLEQQKDCKTFEPEKGNCINNNGNSSSSNSSNNNTSSTIPILTVRLNGNNTLPTINSSKSSEPTVSSSSTTTTPTNQNTNNNRRFNTLLKRKRTLQNSITSSSSSDSTTYKRRLFNTNVTE